MKKLVLVILLFALALSACQAESTSTPGPGPAPAGYTPKYEKNNCPFEVPQGVTVECGTLTVPEDRANPQGRSVKLAVARFKATTTSPAPDPIIYLEGGPGGSPLRSYVKNFTTLFGAYAQKRDLILIDQRGTGYSDPALDCTEVTQLALDQLDESLTPEQSDAQSTQALRACRDRLSAKGINLAAYTSAANAADLNDLRTALGIKEWNLYGISYGTRLALTALRDTKAGIRSVIIDSVFPPQTSLVANPPSSFARSLNLMFESCAADSACNAAYPNLKQVLFDTVKQLNASPAKMKVTQPDLGGIGTPGQKLDAVLDGRGLLAFVFQSFYSSELIPSLPAIIYEAKNGRFEMIAQLQGQFLGQYKDISQGMYYSVECFENVPFTTPAQAEEAFKQQPDVADALGSPKGMFEACKVWNVPAAGAIENQAVKSDVPTLVIAGQFDPITPPDWAKLAADSLSKSTLVTVPAAGHGPSLSKECPQGIALAFLDNPAGAPDTSCLANTKLAYSVPVTKVDVKLAPFDSRLMGFSALTPADWKAAGGIPGFYTPDGSVLNPSQLLLQAAPISIDQFLGSITGSLKDAGIELAPSTQKFNVQSAGGLKWSFYEADGGLIKIDMALANNGKKTFIVLLQSQWNERQALLQAVFVPIVEAMVGQ